MKPENKERLSHDLFHLRPLNFLDGLPEAKLLTSDIMLKPKFTEYIDLQTLSRSSVKKDKKLKTVLQYYIMHTRRAFPALHKLEAKKENGSCLLTNSHIPLKT